MTVALLAIMAGVRVMACSIFFFLFVLFFLCWQSHTKRRSQVSPTFYLSSGEFLSVVGGVRAGTLQSWLDLPGYALATLFFQQYPAMLAAGGWAKVFRRLQLHIVAATACVISFYALETQTPTTRAHPELAG